MEEAFSGVLQTRCLPFPEKSGEVIRSENNGVVPDALANAAVIALAFQRCEGTMRRDYEGSFQLYEGGQSSPPQTSSLIPLKDFNPGIR